MLFFAGPDRHRVHRHADLHPPPRDTEEHHRGGGCHEERYGPEVRVNM